MSINSYLTPDFRWNEKDLQVVLPLLTALAAYVSYWFIAKSKKIKERFYSKYDFDTASSKHIFFGKFTGFVLMGVAPLLVCLIFLPQFTLADYGLAINAGTTVFSLLWIAILVSIGIGIQYPYSLKNPKSMLNYPEVRAKVWSRLMVFRYALGWVIFLFGYEFLFRGILLFSLMHCIGLWPAIAINVVLYSAFHIPKYLDETIATVPLGLIFCIFTVLSGTIWIAFIVHVIISWTNSYASFKQNPEMRFQNKNETL